MSVASTGEIKALLYGPPEKDPTLWVRIQSDMLSSALTVLHLYGDYWRAPTRLLTWDANDYASVKRAYQACNACLWSAENLQGRAYYEAIADAVGAYTDLLREMRTLARKASHKHLEAYAKASERHLVVIKDPALYAKAAAGDNEELIALILATCAKTRKRMGDQMLTHGVHGHPMMLHIDYTHQTDEGT